ncbi:uncharacterized protein LOC143021223 [Oratosquilla oratoria]|uniref:uncharacterized protein LOC143021223 n=1 Tax=Oratosquilla oratoria TaxID=337810 RepID=UPI003F7761D0
MKPFNYLLAVLATGMVVLAQDSRLIRVTCTPAPQSNGCKCNPDLPNQPYLFFPELDDVPLRCNISLRVGSVPNDCRTVDNEPKFTQCSVTIPESLLVMVNYHLDGEGVGSIGGLFVVNTWDCPGECEVYDTKNGCVLHEDCVKCMRDFRAFFPGTPVDTSDCF